MKKAPVLSECRGRCRILPYRYGGVIKTYGRYKDSYLLTTNQISRSERGFAFIRDGIKHVQLLWRGRRGILEAFGFFDRPDIYHFFGQLHIHAGNIDASQYSTAGSMELFWVEAVDVVAGVAEALQGLCKGLHCDFGHAGETFVIFVGLFADNKSI